MRMGIERNIFFGLIFVGGIFLPEANGTSYFLLGTFGQNEAKLSEELENLAQYAPALTSTCSGRLLIGLGNETIDFSRIEDGSLLVAAQQIINSVSTAFPLRLGIPAGALYYGWGTDSVDPGIQAIIELCRDRAVTFVPMIQHNLFDVETSEIAIAITEDIVAEMDNLVGSNLDVMNEGWGFSELGIHGAIANPTDIASIISATLGMGDHLQFVLSLGACFSENRLIDENGQPFLDPATIHSDQKAAWGLDVSLYKPEGGLVGLEELTECVDLAQGLFCGSDRSVVSWRTYGFHDNEVDLVLAAFARWSAFECETRSSVSLWRFY